MAETQQTEEPSIIEFLRERTRRAEDLLQRPEITLEALYVFFRPVRSRLERIYGKDSPLLADFPARPIDRSIVERKTQLAKVIQYVHRIIKALEAAPGATKTPLLGNRIFIGHGRSLVWLQLKDFIRETFALPCDEFNVEPAAGLSTTERLQAMLEHAGFAFVVMTADEKHADGLTYARPNVIHEAGLFQGKLGTRRAIVLLEEGCSDFSNIAGLTHIPFPKEKIRACFEDVRRVLKREGLI